MSGRSSSGLKDNESGGSENFEDNGETDHKKLGASQQQMSGEHPEDSQDNEIRGTEVLYTNGDLGAPVLDALPQETTCKQPNRLQDDGCRGSPVLEIIDEDPQHGHSDFDADVEFLDLSSTYMESKAKQMLARAMERGELKKLEILVLEENHGDLGMRAMLNALRRHHLVGLRKLYLWEVSSYDQLTVAEEGTEIIADALADRALPNVEVIDMRGCLPKVQHSRTRFDAVKSIFTKCSLGDGRLKVSCHICLGCLVCNTRSGTIQTWECLRCLVGRLHVYSGDTGIQKLGRAFKQCPYENLKELFLQQNYIGDKGASELAKVLRRGLLPSLERLDLQNNPVGKEGAENIIFAFLRNPLLTTRVHMQWPHRLQRQRYVAFRESNIRLAVRLKDPDLDIETSEVAKKWFGYPRYNLARPQGESWDQSTRHPLRLRLLCQANWEHPDKFVDHDVKILRSEDGALVEPDGIEFRVLSIFTATPPAYVDREPTESVEYDTIRDDNKSGDLGAPEGKYLTMSGPVSSMSTSMQKKEKETVLKRSKGVNRIFIKKRSLGLPTAEAFDMYSQKRKPADSPKSLMERLRKWGFPGGGAKTNEAMKAIVQELLMLADRKPDEFFHMFGLRQVLLKNPIYADEEKGLYSRRWICNSCFGEYKKRNLRLVFPITTDFELGQ